MPFKLDLNEEGVRRFIRDHPGLTREGKNRLYTNLDYCLREDGDSYIQNAARPGPDPDVFWFDILLQDPPGTGPLFQFWFAVNAAPAVYGLLQVLYVQEERPPGI